MDYHILAILGSGFMLLMTPSAFNSKKYRLVVRFSAIILGIWGLAVFHPIVIIIALSAVFCTIIYWGVNCIDRKD